MTRTLRWLWIVPGFLAALALSCGAAAASNPHVLVSSRQGGEESVLVELRGHQREWRKNQNQGALEDRHDRAAGTGSSRGTAPPRRGAGLAGRCRRAGISVQPQYPASPDPRDLTPVNRFRMSPQRFGARRALAPRGRPRCETCCSIAGISATDARWRPEGRSRARDAIAGLMASTVLYALPKTNPLEVRQMINSNFTNGRRFIRTRQKSKCL